jgi:hypothetical protein
MNIKRVSRRELLQGAVVGGSLSLAGCSDNDAGNSRAADLEAVNNDGVNHTLVVELERRSDYSSEDPDSTPTGSTPTDTEQYNFQLEPDESQVVQDAVSNGGNYRLRAALGGSNDYSSEWVRYRTPAAEEPRGPFMRVVISETGSINIQIVQDY